MGRFLAASQRRSNERRAARPLLARQARSWIAAGALAWAALAAGGVEPFRRRRRSGLAWWGLTGLMLDWHLGMVETEDGQPRPLGPADACTLARAWLVPIAADTPAPLVCGLAAATDGLDGVLARAGRPTRLGRDLEGLVDAAFAMAALRGAARRGWLGRPVAAIEAARLAGGTAYAFARYFGSSASPAPEVMRAGRVTAIARTAGLIAAGLRPPARRRHAGRDWRPQQSREEYAAGVAETRAATPERLVDAINDLSGRHPGFRAAHAKGTLCAGEFTPAPAAAELTRAAHMQGDPVRVTVRFSNGSGDPGAPDGERRDGRGMAIKFYLPDGSTTDIVAITIPVFFVRTPEDFLGFTQARKEDPETGEIDMEKVGAFVAAHPETAAALQLILPTFVPPRSYATCAFNSLHAFQLVNAAGDERWIRYRIEPEAGVASVPEDEIDGLSPDYLQEEIRERLEREPVRFKLLARLAEEGDPLDDPTVAWPDDRELVELGTLELTGLDTSREVGDDVLVFDPTRVTDGIEPSDDPILHVRSTAYSVSVERRSGVPRPT